MGPKFLTPSQTDPYVYYSLQAPTLPEKLSDLRELPSTMKLLRELKRLMDVFIQVCRQRPKLNGTDSYDFLV